jgi:two-component system, OmpR family, phosphate regulon response regulator PhoB
MNSSANLDRDAAQEEREPSAQFVILVDDDLDVAEMYRLGLVARGFRVRVVGEPADFFTAVANEMPDAAVLDWRLPGMSGADILEQLRSEPRTAALPVFLLSNFLGDQNGAIDRVFELGALAWLRKSVTPPHVLAERLQQAVGRKRYARRFEDRY